MGSAAPVTIDAATMAPLHLRAERCPAWWVLGNRYTFLIVAEDSAGVFSLAEIVVPPRRGTPLHTHRREDETFHVIEGEVEFTAGGQTFHAQPGSVVFGPRGVPHSFCNVGDLNARMLCVATPGGLERFFTEAGVPASDRTSVPPAPTPEDIERLRQAAPNHGIEAHDPCAGEPAGSLPLFRPRHIGSSKPVRALTEGGKGPVG